MHGDRGLREPRRRGYFNNAVTEIVAARAPAVHHVRLQREAAPRFHIAHCAVVLAKDAHYASHVVSLGALCPA